MSVPAQKRSKMVKRHQGSPRHNPSCPSGRAHTPIVSARQARFMGAEYGRKKAGKKGKTDMSKAELKSHLKEWGRKR